MKLDVYGCTKKTELDCKAGAYHVTAVSLSRSGASRGLGTAQAADQILYMNADKPLREVAEIMQNMASKPRMLSWVFRLEYQSWLWTD